jgi:hypothetical protein
MPLTFLLFTQVTDNTMRDVVRGSKETKIEYSTYRNVSGGASTVLHPGTAHNASIAVPIALGVHKPFSTRPRSLIAHGEGEVVMSCRAWESLCCMEEGVAWRARLEGGSLDAF